MGNSLPEGFRFAIAQTAHFRGHAAEKDIVDRLDHLTAGAEIPAEHDFAALARLCLFSRCIVPVFLQENARIRQPELVNGLLYVAHHEAILLFPGQGGENRILNTVGILVFIHQDFPEPPSDLRGSGGGAGAVLTQHQIQHLMLQIGKIQDPPGLFGLGKLPVKLANQGNDSPGSGCRLVQIFQYQRTGIGKCLQLFGKILLAGIPGSLDPVLQIRVGALFNGGPAAEGNGAAIHNIVPCSALSQLLHGLQGFQQVGCRLFQALGHLRLPQACAQHTNLAVQIFHQVVHQESAPDRLGCIGAALHIRRFQAGIQPALRI